MIPSSEIKEAALRAGFGLCGITRAVELESEHARFVEWLGEGFGGSLDYLERNVEKRFDASLLVEGAVSVAVCALSYKNELSCGYPADGIHPKVASYAQYDDYHDTIRRMLRRMAAELRLDDRGVVWRGFSDSAPVAEKSLAVRAGLGAIGRNSLLITPRFGSFVLLGELIFAEQVDEYDTPIGKDLCLNCHRCIDRCPTQAIKEGRMIDVSKCISRLTVEPGMGNRPTGDLHGWIFGCEICQSGCPHNRRTPLYSSGVLRKESENEKHMTADGKRATVCDMEAKSAGGLHRRFSPLEMSVDDWLALDEEAFAKKFGPTPLKRAGLERLKSNVAQMVTNWSER